MARAPELTGKPAALYIGATLVARMQSCDIDTTIDYHNPAPWGDTWKARVFDKADWTLTAKRYSIVASLNHFPSLAAWQTVNQDTVVRVKVYQSLALAKVVFEADGVIESGKLSMPEGLIEEDLTVSGNGDAPITCPHLTS